jgi:hypothetical protein
MGPAHNLQKSGFFLVTPAERLLAKFCQKVNNPSS